MIRKINRHRSHSFSIFLIRHK